MYAHIRVHSRWTCCTSVQYLMHLWLTSSVISGSSTHSDPEVERSTGRAAHQLPRTRTRTQRRRAATTDHIHHRFICRWLRRELNHVNVRMEDFSVYKKNINCLHNRLYNQYDTFYWALSNVFMTVDITWVLLSLLSLWICIFRLFTCEDAMKTRWGFK